MTQFALVALAVTQSKGADGKEAPAVRRSRLLLRKARLSHQLRRLPK